MLVRHQSRAWCWCMCLGLALMLSGVVVGGAYLYRYYVMEVSSEPEDNLVSISYSAWSKWCVVKYESRQVEMQLTTLQQNVTDAGGSGRVDHL